MSSISGNIGAASGPAAAISQFRLLPGGAWHLGVVVRRTYLLADGKHWQVSTKPTPPDPDEETPWKPGTDVVVRGHVYAPGGAVTETFASVEVGSVRRKIRATGERVVEGLRGGIAVFSDPSPFERIPLTFERSYGGFDRGAYELYGDTMADLAVEAGGDLELVSKFGYARNQRGVGFYIAGATTRLPGARVPNLDDPDDPVTPERLIRASALDWIDAPTPAALDWLPATSFPRCLHFGLAIEPRRSQRPIREVELGDIGDSDLDGTSQFPGIYDVRALSGASPGMGRARLVGGEPVRLIGLHPSSREITSALPGEALRVMIRPPGCPPFEVAGELNSVVFDLDRNQLALSWGAKLEVAGRYPESELALVTAEARFVA